VVLLGLQYVPLTHLGLPGWGAGLILAAMVAAIAAVVGYRYPLRLDTYLAGAFLQSGLAIILWAEWQFVHHSLDSDKLLHFAFVNFVPTALWFFSGAWVGGLIRCFRDRSYSRERLSARLARRLIGQGGQEHGASFDKRVARLAAVIAAVAPVLTFIASLIGTAFSRK